ncbi:hypothetical protein HDU81_001364, partial [Chytriomyces hyalinus]
MEFAMNYIRKSRETLPDATSRDTFEQSLCSCHTIRIEFQTTTFSQGSFDSAMLKLLASALKPMFAIPPSMLARTYTRVFNFLEDFTKAAGPVFIVLDEIGNVFRGDDFLKQEQVLAFCNEIIGNWFSLPHVFFIVLGSASFVEHVAEQPPNYDNFFEFESLGQAFIPNVEAIYFSALARILK